MRLAFVSICLSLSLLAGCSGFSAAPIGDGFFIIIQQKHGGLVANVENAVEQIHHLALIWCRENGMDSYRVYSLLDIAKDDRLQDIWDSVIGGGTHTSLVGVDVSGGLLGSVTVMRLAEFSTKREKHLAPCR